jgi:hypothetical protein
MSPMTTERRRAPRAARPAPLSRPEGRVAAARGLVLLAALISFVLSVSLWFTGNEMEGIFVGIWVPSILALGATILPRPS